MKYNFPPETKSAKVISVIETVTLAGDGTDESPLYEVKQYGFKGFAFRCERFM